MTSATEIKTVAGEESQTQHGNIIEYAWRLQKKQLCEDTIKHRTRRLEKLVQMGGNLANPDSIESILAVEKLTPASKREFVAAYTSYTKTFGITWIPVKVRYEPRQPFIPLEAELDQLIAGCGKKTATFLQVLKATGARSGEACKLKWIDVNQESNTISINNPEKGSHSRTIPVSRKTIAMMNAMPRKYGDFIFNPNLRAHETTFLKTRTRLALVCQNPRLGQIHFHTFRHWFGRTAYSKYRDLLRVKYLLGHKRVENTEIYTRPLDFSADEYIVRRAETPKEEDALIEAGFEYVRYDEKEQCAIYRKRK